MRLTLKKLIANRAGRRSRKEAMAATAAKATRVFRNVEDSAEVPRLRNAKGHDR